VAVVIWIFSGGGEAEIEGLIPFFRKSFPDCEFQRKTPVRQKRGPKPGKEINALGKSGKSLSRQIKYQLPHALRSETCNLILVLDDLDCRNPDERKKAFSDVIDCVSGASFIKRFVAFAAPELEAWVLADWENTFARYSDFRGFHKDLQYTLSRDYQVPLNAPESFSAYDPEKDSCKEKLSEIIQQAVEATALNNKKSVRYSKAIHTPGLLICAVAENVAAKCPLFKELYNFLNQLSKRNHS
jgi:hypothetical protein